MYPLFFLLLAFIFSPAHANPQQDYLTRFQTYLSLNQALSLNPSSAFIQFIQKDTPLANKLRDRWLILLGQKKQWNTFKKYYRQSPLTALTCYAALADYYAGQQTEALNTAKSLWLSGQSQPGACSELFELLLKQPDFDERYIDARIILAFYEENLPLIQFLLKQYRQPKGEDVQWLDKLNTHPEQIANLPRDPFHGYFYLYGLKKLYLKKPALALQLWEAALKEQRLIESQQQQFIAFVTHQKTQHNEEDASSWFNQLKPSYYNETLLDGQIRLALRQFDWPKVEALIRHYQNKSDLCWQYWLARALEAQGKVEEAKPLYEQLAQTRQYYGFLASVRLNKPLQFEYETQPVSLSTLQQYQPITRQISQLHQQKKDGDASQLLNDFTSELPMEEKVALIHWVANILNWYSKSIAMSSQEELKNHLNLRFPLAHRQQISTMASTFNLPEAFIYAIIRQESSFNSQIVSPAGAKGLMQLMPTTASIVAKNKHVQYRNPKDLFNTPTNIKLGSAYLATLAHRFNNHPVLMAAAYNAGPTQAFHWLKNHTPKEMDVWIETLPWHETRNYLKNVIAFYAVYQYRMHQESKIDSVLEPVNKM